MILKELLEEAVNVLIDLFRAFLMEEMSHSLEHDGFIKQRYVFLESPTVDVLLSPRRIVRQILISHYELHRYTNLSTGPRCSQLPISVLKKKHKPIGY